MAFEWKTIGGETPAEQTPSTSAPQMTPSAAQQPATAAVQPVSAELPVTQPDPALPVCELHNVAVNATEKSGYNATYDSEVYNSYDTGVNSDENAIVS